jgi:hypothetical protein
MTTRAQLHSTNASTNHRRTDLDFLSLSQARILAALAGFVDIPNRGSLEKRADPPATCGFVVEARLPWFVWIDPERRRAAAR